MNTNVNQKLTLIQKLDQSSPAGIAGLPEVADRFKHIYSVMNGGNTEVSNIKYEAEKFHFMKLITDKADLQKCTKLSLYGCFIDMAVNGLSFDPSMKHAYVVAFPFNIGTKDNPKWESRATLMIDGRGELVIRVKQGQIKYADNPIIVYEGDEFVHGTSKGSVFLEHKAVFPRKSDSIIASYLRIERPDGSVDYKVMGIDEILKLKEFSKQKNSLAWTSGLPGMVQTKTIKHAFRSYPKVKLGNFTRLQTEAIEPAIEPVIDYGLNGSMPANNLPDVSGSFEPTVIIEPIKKDDPVQNISDDSFMETEEVPGNGKSFEDDEF